MPNALQDDAYELSPGRTVRRFSVEHLLLDNACADLGAAALATELDRIPSDTAEALARRLRQLDRPAPGDRALAMAAIRLGNLLGLGATWGVAREADLLWGAAALLLQAREVRHPNELPDD